MLLKYTQAQKRIKATGAGKPQRTAGGMVKLTSGHMTVVPKIHRKVIKVANKRPGALHRTPTAVKREQIPVDPCENSNDSGLGFDHHLDYHTSIASHPALHFSDKTAAWQTDEAPEVKRRRLEIKLESDDANDNFTFPETVRQQAPRTICLPVRGSGRGRVVLPVPPLTLTSQLSASSRTGLAQLLIVCQPEQQHRARYQTEGSRGAVKDRTGNGFPVVKLVGYDGPATLQVFIGTDQGRVAPHMFYQACRVSGKNSTPCIEKKIDGTIVIEVDIEPSKDMVVTCDCVGILKERNVDVEHRFPEEGSGRSKKKSTRCRMVFRTTITNRDGSQETLQVTSQPIVCTQPPGVPEICKKSLSSCSVRGGQELFILGKNFLKDTRVVFQEGDGSSPAWSQSVQPDKEFLQQSHLVCVVPAYQTTDIPEPVSVRLIVESSGKASEAHSFLYLPDSLQATDSAVLGPDGNIVNNSVISQVKFLKGSGAYRGSLINRRRYRNGGSAGVFPSHLPVAAAAPYMATQTSPGKEEKVQPVMMWEKPVDVMMPPPPPSMLAMVRRSSVQMIVPDTLAPEELKQEVPEPTMEPPKPMANVSDLSSTQSPSMDVFRRFVSNNSLPSINVGTYLSNIEGSNIYANKLSKTQIMNEMPQIMIPSPTSVNKALFSGDSTNLLTTVEPILVNQSSVMPFDGRNVNSSASQSPQDNLSVIVNSSMIHNKSPDSHICQNVQKQMTETQNVAMDLLMTSAMNKQTHTSTERLDAFVNSAAESHISPTPTSPIAMTSVINEHSVINPVSDMVVNGRNDMNKLQETSVPPMMQATSLPISPHTSPHHRTPNINEGSLCSLLNSPMQVSSQTSSNQQASTVSGIQPSLEHQLNSQNVNATQTNINNVMQSSPAVSPKQTQEYSNMTNSLEQQLSAQTVASSQLGLTDINSLMQSSPQMTANQVHSLSNLQVSLAQQLSPRSVNSTQVNHTDLNLMQPSPHSSVAQGQALSSYQVTLEQQLSTQAISPPQINRSNLTNLIQSSPQNVTSNEAQVMSNLQASLEQHISTRTVNSSQISHPETVQSSNLSLNNMGNAMQTSAQSSANEVQVLCNLQASLERHLTSPLIGSIQHNHESLTNESITLNTLNSTIPASPQIQAAVSKTQALSDFQASIEHHLSSQAMNSAHPVLESITPSTHTSTTLNSALDTSQAVVSQTQSLANLQMSLGHLTSQVLTSSQPRHETITNSALSINDSIQNVVSETQVLSNFQSPFEQRHPSQGLVTSQPPPDPMMSMERLSSSIQNSAEQSQNRALSNFQCMGHLSSQVLNSPQSNRTESFPSSTLSIDDTHTLDSASPISSLISKQPINIISNSGSTSSSMVLSPPSSHHSPASVLSSPGISMSSTPTMVLSQMNLANHNSQQMELDSSGIVLNTAQTLLGTNHSSSARELQIQSSPRATVEPNSIHQFEQVTSNISQNLPIQVATLNQYEQCQELQSANKDPERKEAAAYMMPQALDIKPQAPAQAIKKCEEGMPVPHELTQMSEHDLIRYINPSCFDTV